MAYHALSWHEGEEKIHALTKVPPRDNPMNPTLAPRAAHQIQIYPLMALGTIDEADENRPWCSLWGGEAPISQPVAPGGVIGIRTTIDATFDPVAEILLGRNGDGEVVRQHQGVGGSMVSLLSISLEQRSRWKLYGRMLAGALSASEKSDETADDTSIGKAGSVQLVLKIEQSLGNCPKYLNKKVITARETLQPRLASTDINLCDEAVDLIRKADMFFISSSHKFEDMDTNHRGGPPGFLRVHKPEPDSSTGSVLVWPEYSGNNLYQTLGNLMSTPRAGLCIPDFLTGDVLYVTGDTEVLINEAANRVIAKSKLAVQLTVTAARLVKDGLGFRGKPVDDPTAGQSPYNPRIRYLRSEKVEVLDNASDAASMHPDVTAKLIKKHHLTPSITKYRFALSDPAVFGPWTAGQYVAFDFSDELDMGYSHMRDDDPGSLNDDYLRTFTVSSPPNSLGVHGEEFEVMIRRVGSVTGWLSQQREGLMEAGVKGFAGSFSFDIEEGQKALFIAAGIGITPLLSQAKAIKNLLVRWSVGIRDVGVVLDVWKQCSDEVRQNMVVYLSGEDSLLTREQDQKALSEVMKADIKVERRRMAKEDLIVLAEQVSKWYLCTAPTMRKVIQDWMPGKSIIFENFDY